MPKGLQRSQIITKPFFSYIFLSSCLTLGQVCSRKAGRAVGRHERSWGGRAMWGISGNSVTSSPMLFPSSPSGPNMSFCRGEKREKRMKTREKVYSDFSFFFSSFVFLNFLPNFLFCFVSSFLSLFLTFLLFFLV